MNDDAGLKMNPPNNTQIELVFGCNRMCEFCGIQGIWRSKEDRVVKYMEMDLALELANNFGQWFGRKRIEFAMRGEPTLHPNLIDIISAFRQSCRKAQLQVTTNGTVLRKLGPEFIQELFKAGLNLLLIDSYVKYNETMEVAKKSKIPILDYYDPDNKINVYYYNSHKIRYVVDMKDIGKENKKKVTRIIYNQAGSVPNKIIRKYGGKVLEGPLQKRCSRPFREITVHYNGIIPLCCVDWKTEFTIGKFPDDGSLEDIWNSRIFNIMRHLLYNKVRIVRPCYKCDFPGLRPGLLPEVEVEPYDINEIVRHLKNYRKFESMYASKEIIYKPPQRLRKLFSKKPSKLLK